jgi:hypothetical protein
VPPALVGGWVARFAVPQQITSDRGSQFCSSIWDSVTQQLGIKSRLTTPYYPQSNGAVEQFLRCLKDMLRAQLAGSEWVDHIPWVMLWLRVAPQEDTFVSGVEPVYGAPLSLPGQFLSVAEPPPAEFVQQLLPHLPCKEDRTGCGKTDSTPLPAALQKVAFVYIQSPPMALGLTPVYHDPYRVRVSGQKYFVVDISGRPQAVSVENIKPHLGLTPITVALGPHRGHPPKPGSH